MKLEHAFVLWQLGMAYHGAENHRVAVDYLKKARKIYQEIGNPRMDKVQEVLDALDKGSPYDAKHQFE